MTDPQEPVQVCQRKIYIGMDDLLNNFFQKSSDYLLCDFHLYPVQSKWSILRNKSFKFDTLKWKEGRGGFILLNL